jgi:hypothetical protein
LEEEEEEEKGTREEKSKCAVDARGRSRKCNSPERKALVLHKYDVPQMASIRAVTTAQMPPPSCSTHNVLGNDLGDREALDPWVRGPRALDPWVRGPRITYDALTPVASLTLQVQTK